jgi:hypothetical protein
MKLLARIFFTTVAIAASYNAHAQTIYYDNTREGHLVFHPIKTDASGRIVPWYSEEPGIAYDFVINAVWNFWDTMRRDPNGIPYYMNHQVWRPNIDPRGLGGDQLQMALSSWQLLYQYSGNELVKDNMKFIADYYLTHSLSPSNAKWPNIPFPYNTLLYSGYFDGDMVIGKDYTQPDKAGSFGWELIKLHKMTGNQRYLDAAVDIANTLANHTKEGNADESPLPFKVNAFTGETGILKSNTGDGSEAGRSSYTSNWAGTLELWMSLIKMKKGNTSLYETSLNKMIVWMKKYPMVTNKWGPFFEDVPGWSDTQINAVTFASFIMDHRDLFPDWKKNVRDIFNWVYGRLGNNTWKKYGAVTVNEQTAYMTPGNSHTSRQGSAELRYASLSGDTTKKDSAIRRLNWATYMVDKDGKNCYPRDEVWLTDGYGDYVRHYLRAMSAFPELAPSNSNHLVASTSIVTQIDYAPDFNKRLVPDIKKEDVEKVYVFYRTFDTASTETFRMTRKPSRIVVGNRQLTEGSVDCADCWTWKPLSTGGILTIRRKSGSRVRVEK